MKGDMAVDGLSLPHVAGRDIQFAADDRFDAGLFRLGIEFKCSEHRAMIGDGDTVHAVFLAFIEEIGDANGSIKQTVLGMNMEMGEILHSLLSFKVLKFFAERKRPGEKSWRSMPVTTEMRVG